MPQIQGGSPHGRATARPSLREVCLVGDPERRYMHMTRPDLGEPARARPREGRRDRESARVRP